MPIPRMSKKDLTEFVLGYCDRQVFTSFDCSENDIGHVFMVLAFSDIPKEDIEKVGCIWEWMKEAGPMAVNGNPMFMSCRLMHKKDWEICRKAINSELKRRENISIDIQQDLDLEEKKDVS